MPVLTNPKYERFAQELAAGKSADEAYQLAGYRPNRGNASTLKQNQSILDRVTELLAERESIHAQATADAVKVTGLSKQWVIETLMENVGRAMQTEEVKRPDGTGTGEYRYEGSVANKALELLGKEVGMFVERREDVTNKRTLEQIDSRIRQLLSGREEDGASDAAGGAGNGLERDQVKPTVSGVGRA